MIAIFSFDHDAGGQGHQGAGGGGQVGDGVHPRGEGESGPAGEERGDTLKYVFIEMSVLQKSK